MEKPLKPRVRKRVKEVEVVKEDVSKRQKTVTLPLASKVNPLTKKKIVYAPPSVKTRSMTKNVEIEMTTDETKTIENEIEISQAELEKELEFIQTKEIELESTLQHVCDNRGCIGSLGERCGFISMTPNQVLKFLGSDYTRYNNQYTIHGNVSSESDGLTLRKVKRYLTIMQKNNLSFKDFSSETWSYFSGVFNKNNENLYKWLGGETFESDMTMSEIEILLKDYISKGQKLIFTNEKWRYFDQKFKDGGRDLETWLRMEYASHNKQYDTNLSSDIFKPRETPPSPTNENTSSEDATDSNLKFKDLVWNVDELPYFINLKTMIRPLHYTSKLFNYIKDNFYNLCIENTQEYRIMKIF